MNNNKCPTTNSVKTTKTSSMTTRNRSRLSSRGSTSTTHNNSTLNSRVRKGMKGNGLRRDSAISHDYQKRGHSLPITMRNSTPAQNSLEAPAPKRRRTSSLSTRSEQPNLKPTHSESTKPAKESITTTGTLDELAITQEEQPPPNKKIRCRGTKLFLTYSQCNTGTKEELLRHLQELIEVKHYIICKETHANGGKHFHCYLELMKRCDIQNPKFFDWHQHPKFEKVKHTGKVMNYVKKDGDYITDLNFDLHTVAVRLAEQGRVNNALLHIIKGDPSCVHKLEQYEKGFKIIARLNKKTVPKFRPEDFHQIPFKWDRQNECLIITGESGIGKTQWARTVLFKNPLLVRHIDKLKVLDPYVHDGIIFDDMSFTHWPRESCIHLLDLDEESQINVKCTMAIIPPGFPRVFTTNREAPTIWPCYDRAITRRLSVLRITTDLRKLPPKATGQTQSKDPVLKEPQETAKAEQPTIQAPPPTGTEGFGSGWSSGKVPPK